MKKKILLIATLIMMFLVNTLPVYAAENEWVLDEVGVLSEETMDYVKNLNENVFPSYSSKPQLALMIIDKLPAGYTMDEFKLEQFNAYGVGTKEENCGLLFVFAISDREYGLEIGEGYKRGSSLRRELETDFVNSDIKALLREEKYDAATMEIVKHLEGILLNADEGVYAQKDIEQEAADKAFAIFMLGAIVLGCTFFVVYKLVRRIAVVIVTGNTIKEYDDALSTTKINKIKLKKDVVRRVLTGYNFSIFNIKEDVVERIYNSYISEVRDLLYDIGINMRHEVYMDAVRKINTLEAFKSHNLTLLTKIVYDVDYEEDEKERILRYNHDLVEKYVKSHESEIDERVKSSDLIAEMKERCSQFNEFTNHDIELIFEDKHNKLIFDFEFEKFISENEESIDRHFKRSDFYDEVKHHSDYSAYCNSGFRNNTWMLPLLVAHMANNKRSYERRQRQNASSRRYSSSSNYGRSFGGGFSRGGGFSGGW